jgi:hypothetical protein
MKKQVTVIIMLSLMLCLSAFSLPAKSYADISVNVSIPLPRLVIPAPPALIVIPGSYVYYPPDVGVDIFFYHGYWYRPYSGRWFVSTGYNGPWRGVAIGRVPRAVIGVPSGFRHGPVVYERVPYRDVRRNWRGWERERHWDRDRHEGREHHREDAGRREHGGDRHERDRGHAIR